MLQENASCKSTALKRWIVIEMRWYKYILSRTSFVFAEIIWPSLSKKSVAESLMGPSVSTAIIIIILLLLNKNKAVVVIVVIVMNQCAGDTSDGHRELFEIEWITEHQWRDKQQRRCHKHHQLVSLLTSTWTLSHATCNNQHSRSPHICYSTLLYTVYRVFPFRRFPLRRFPFSRFRVRIRVWLRVGVRIRV